ATASVTELCGVKKTATTGLPGRELARMALPRAFSTTATARSSLAALTGAGGAAQKSRARTAYGMDRLRRVYSRTFIRSDERDGRPYPWRSARTCRGSGVSRLDVAPLQAWEDSRCLVPP